MSNFCRSKQSQNCLAAVFVNSSTALPRILRTYLSSSANYAFNRSSGFTSQIWPINGRITFHRWIEDYRRALPSNTTYTHTLTYTHRPVVSSSQHRQEEKESRNTLVLSLETLPHPSDYDVTTLTASSSLRKFVTVKGGDETQSIYKQLTLLLQQLYTYIYICMNFSEVTLPCR